MAYLEKETLVFRVNDEIEADELIKDARTSNKYELVGSKITKKEKKEKGEIIDEWFLVELKKDYSK